MGAGTNATSTVVCTQTAQLTLDDKKVAHSETKDYDSNASTISAHEKNKIIETLADLRTHDDELQKLKEIGSHLPILPTEVGTDFSFKREIVWKNAIGFLLLHLIGAVGGLMMITGFCDIRTSIFIVILCFIFAQGVTMGAHRLWSHRSYKAKQPLRLALLLLHTIVGQNCLWVWVRDHRQHHKFSDTDADPHNANRGFFFSHIGWLMSRKHPKVIEYGKKIDMSDLEADYWIMFQKNHYKVLYTIFSFFLPTFLPVLFWNEDPIIAIFTAFFARTIIVLNVTWCVNSVAHLYGTRPYDKTILPVENALLSFLASGEGWHNYHHAFPWDYRASELGTPFNLTGTMLDLFATYGWVYDLREATHTMVKNRVIRTGDESHKTYGTEEGRKATKTLFNIFNHPLNPTFNSIHKPQPKVIGNKGYALIEKELNKNETDEKFLHEETEEIIRQQKTDLNVQNGIKKYIVEKIDFSGDLINNTNNNAFEGEEVTINNNNKLRERTFTN